MSDHTGHDTWPLISRPGTVWCRTCQEHYTPAVPVHKAEPAAIGSELTGTGTCTHCGEPVHRVPGGHGPTWVHTGSGAVAGSGAPS